MKSLINSFLIAIAIRVAAVMANLGFMDVVPLSISAIFAGDVGETELRSQWHFALLKEFFYLSSIAISIFILIYIIKPIINTIKRSRLALRKHEVNSLFNEIGMYHSQMLYRLSDQDITLPTELKGVWLEYLLTDLTKIFGQAFGRNDFRASLFVQLALDPNPVGNQPLVSVVSSTFHGSNYAPSVFFPGEGFCGTSFENEKIIAGAYRYGWRRCFKKNPTFADNKDHARKSADRRRSYLCIPIRAKKQGALHGEVAAVLCIDSKNQNDFRALNDELVFLSRELDKSILHTVVSHVLNERFCT